MKDKTINPLFALREKYLNKYSSGNWKAETNNYEGIKVAVVIPALSEYDNIRRLLESLILNDNTHFSSVLILFIVNNLKSSDSSIKHNNQKTINLFKAILDNTYTDDKLLNDIRATGIRIGYIDACSDGNELPEKDGGVGLARKTGMDIALTLFDFNDNTNHILACLDSDCTVPSNYITEIYKLTADKNFKAGYINYEHSLADPETLDAIICYEIFLHYYVAGLKYAQSPYAFHTIGSTMMCNAEAYIKIGGMNKRKAAEDFYFMEKLSKSFPIKKLNTASIFPSSRVSYRVPFGTGQRVSRFIKHVQNEYLLYSPKSFIVLKKWLELFNDKQILTSEEYLEGAKKISPALFEFLTTNNFEIEWTRIVANSKQPEQIQKQKMFWFDGFRTLKLIHHLRDTQFQLRPMFRALDEMFGLFELNIAIKTDEDIPEIEIQKRYLETLRKLT